jgi:hypothetical protein
MFFGNVYNRLRFTLFSIFGPYNISMTSLVKLRDKDILKILAFDLEWSLDKINTVKTELLPRAFATVLAVKSHTY